MADEDDIRRQVISAVWQLYDRHGEWRTSADIAKYLEHDEKIVRRALSQLKAKRIFRDRQRSGRKVWMPWEQA